MPHQEPALPENDPLKRPKMLKEHFFLPSQPHYRTYDQEKLNQEKRQKNPKIRKKDPKMPPKEPKWHENEHNNPLKRPENPKRTFFCPRSHIIGRLTKNNSTKKKGKIIPKYA